MKSKIFHMKSLKWQYHVFNKSLILAFIMLVIIVSILLLSVSMMSQHSQLSQSADEKKREQIDLTQDTPNGPNISDLESESEYIPSKHSVHTRSSTSYSPTPSSISDSLPSSIYDYNRNYQQNQNNYVLNRNNNLRNRRLDRFNPLYLNHRINPFQFSLSQQHVHHNIQSLNNYPRNLNRLPSQALSQPQQHIRHHIIRDLPDLPASEPPQLRNHSQILSNNSIQQNSNISTNNTFNFFTDLSGIKIKLYFKFKSSLDPVFNELKLADLSVAKENDTYNGIGKVTSQISGIKLWKLVFNSDTRKGSFIKPISAKHYKLKLNNIRNINDVIFYGELADNEDLGDKVCKWDELYTEIRESVFVKKLEKKQYMLDHASDPTSIGYKCFMENSKKVNEIFDKITNDYTVEKERQALQKALEFMNKTISENNDQLLYLKQLTYIILLKDHRKIWWLCEKDGERYKTALVKAIKAILGNSIYILTTFADMDHLCNLLKQSPYKQAICIDLAKGDAKKVVTQVIEQLKNGYNSSTMYHGCNEITAAKRLTFLTNENAPKDSFTRNRMYELIIVGNHLEITGDENLSDIVPSMPTDEELHGMDLRCICQTYQSFE